MPLTVLPDVEALVVAFLRQHASISPLVGTRVSTVRAATPTFPLILITGITGVEIVTGFMDEQRVQVDVYGPEQNTAQSSLIARTVRAVLEQDAPTFDHPRGIVTHVRCLATPRPLPDTDFNPPLPRYTADYGLTLIPHPV